MMAAFNALASTIRSHDSWAGRALKIVMVFSSSWKGRESHPASAYVSGNFNRKELRKSMFVHYVCVKTEASISDTYTIDGN